MFNKISDFRVEIPQSFFQYLWKGRHLILQGWTSCHWHIHIYVCVCLFERSSKHYFNMIICDEVCDPTSEESAGSLCNCVQWPLPNFLVSGAALCKYIVLAVFHSVELLPQISYNTTKINTMYDKNKWISTTVFQRFYDSWMLKQLCAQGHGFSAVTSLPLPRPRVFSVRFHSQFNFVADRQAFRK